MRALLRQLRFQGEYLLSPRLRQIYRAEPDRAVLEELKWQVASGPFAGMRYITQSCGSALAPKVIGCYERELHPVIEKAIGAGYQCFVDIGCAEGYYAVGLAVKTNTPVVAFDNNPQARECLDQLAALNEVSDLVEIREDCGADTFAEFADRKTFLICDIEGAEEQLIDPAISPALLEFDLLIEIHDEPGSTRVRDLIEGRFSDSHRIEHIEFEGRSAADAQHLNWIKRPEFLAGAVDEKRQRGTYWLFAERLHR